MKPTDPSEAQTLPVTPAARESSATLPTAGASHAALAATPEAGRALANYRMGTVIGRGGMGEVLLAQDERIGRDVAIKRLRSEAPTRDEINRFMREARIQARLDHPSIVPVHELGHDDEGRPYFTMKRLAGVTLAESLASTAPQPQRLLRVFAEVALAIDFAHARGVIHRDLKPSNIMLGDFGEVYVIDWGLARVAGDARTAAVASGIESVDGATIDGVMLGTPGYMSPEQMQDAGGVGRPTDVYALGAILFEILTGEPLHPRGPGAIASTLAAAQTSPAARRPDRGVPPELDALCVGALATDPQARPNARMVAEAVQRYLDGDRDVARRRAMAAEHLAAAHEAFAAGRRADAMRAASRALALDPESAGAAELVTALMLEPPREPPPELEVELARAEATDIRRHARSAAVAYGAIFAVTPLAILAGVRSWGLLGAIVLVSTALSVNAWWTSRRPDRTVATWWAYAIGNALLVGLTARMVGPFVAVPAFACVVTMSILSYPIFTHRIAGVIALMMVGWAAPLGLEVAGILPPTWQHGAEGLVIKSSALELTGPLAVALIFVITLVTIAFAGFLAGVVSRAQHLGQRQLLAQAWHLRQLLPAAAR